MLGLIQSFRCENGFGLLELEDGRELTFDVTACVAAPVVGQPVRVSLTQSERGLRAVRVEPEDGPPSTEPARELGRAVKLLQNEGLLSELTRVELRRHLAALRIKQATLAHLYPVLFLYYADDELGPARRAADHFFSTATDQPGTDGLLKLFSDLESAQLDGLSVEQAAARLRRVLEQRGDVRCIAQLKTGGRDFACFSMARVRARRLYQLAALPLVAEP